MQSKIENAGMKALLAEESVTLGGRPEKNDASAQDDICRMNLFWRESGGGLLCLM